MFHYAHPKYLRVPDGIQLSGNLWYLYLSGTAPGEMERYIPNSLANATCIRVLLRDHTYTTLNRLLDEIKDFNAAHLASGTGAPAPNPGLAQVKSLYLGGIAGLYAAANQVLKRTDFFNLTLTLIAVGICCAVEFRSPWAGMLFIAASVLGNFGAFIYMNARGLTLTIDTIPVVSLGIGLGIDYGIYTMAAIRDEVIGGREITDSITTAMRGTGQAVLNTLFVMIGGLSIWLFSPIDFHVRMAQLLIFLMTTNAITGVIILPSFVSAFRPWFITKYIDENKSRPQLKAASLS
jgi:predicted RND superfamily exporter protein